MAKGKNIVLLHGWGACVERMAPLKRELIKLGWKVYVPRLPGFDAKKPSKPWKLEDYTKYVLKKANSKFKRQKYYLFGHSFGGRISILAASKYPKKIEGVILCGAGGISRPNIAKRVIFFVFAKVGKLLLIFLPLANLWRKSLYKVARAHDYDKAEGVMKETVKNIVGQKVIGYVGKINIKTLVVWGEKDKLTPLKDMEKIRNKLPNAKYITFENEGHTVYFDKAKDVAKQIDTWK